MGNAIDDGSADCTRETASAFASRIEAPAASSHGLAAAASRIPHLACGVGRSEEIARFEHELVVLMVLPDRRVERPADRQIPEAEPPMVAGAIRRSRPQHPRST